MFRTRYVKSQQPIIFINIYFLEPCHTELTGPSGRFSTKNFPEKYESNSNCTWDIKVQEGKRIKITFHLFNVSRTQQISCQKIGNFTVCMLCNLLPVFRLSIIATVNGTRSRSPTLMGKRSSTFAAICCKISLCSRVPTMLQFCSPVIRL